MNAEKLLKLDYASLENVFGRFGFSQILPNPDKILLNAGKTIEAYRDLKNDPHVWSCIQSRKSGLVSLDWEIQRNNSSNRIHTEIEAVFAELDISQIERDILEAPLFGFQPLEITWAVAGSNYRKLYPISVQAKPQEWFFYDSEGCLRFKKKGNPKGEIPLPQKIVCARYEPSYINPYGHPLLAKCYWPVTFKNGGVRFWVNFMEKYGMPMLIGQYTRGATYEESEKLARELANMTQDAVIVAPSDMNIEMREAARTSSVELYREMIKHCNAEISKAILSQTLTTELDMGSYAASMTHFKIRREVIISDIRLVEALFNKIIKLIADLNFSERCYPKFKIILNEQDNSQRIERDIKLSRHCGFRFTKAYLNSAYGLKSGDIEFV